jgi:hypothetical protein
MRLKKNKIIKNYAAGGWVAPAVSLGSSILQGGLGLYQTMQGQAMAKDVKEASTARPSEYSEMLKLSRQSDLERKRLDELNRTIGSGIGAAQSAGGRALIGALPGMVRAGDVGTQDILAQRQNAQMVALQQASMGSEREINRNLTREQQQLGMAQSAVEGGLQNIGGGIGQLGKAAMLGVFDSKKTADPTSAATADPTSAATKVLSPEEKQLKRDIVASRGSSARERRIGESAAAGMEDLMMEREGLGQVPLLAESPESIAAKEQALLDQILSSRTAFLKEGGKITKGSFNHKSNPIDIVQKGKKVGEMTGGEVILNPSQQAKLSKESAYFRNLLKKFNKKK